MMWIEIANVSVFWPGLVLLGGLIGFLTGLFGVGGGFLMTPCLYALFGIPYPLAVGSGLLKIFCTGAVSAIKHRRRGAADLRLGTVMAAGASGGVLAGKWMLGMMERHARTVTLFGQPQSLLDLIMNLLFLALMASIMLSILRETAGNKKSGKEEADSALARKLHDLHLPPFGSFPVSGIARMSLWVPAGISLFVGILTGLMGVGGGFVMFPLLIYVMGVPTTVAVGTSTVLIVFASGLGTVVHALSGNVSFPLALLMLAGAGPGIHFGVHLSHRTGGRRIRKYFAAVIGVGMLVVLYSLISDLSGG